MGFLGEIGISPSDLTSGSVVILTVLLVLFGQLIPRRTHERELGQVQKALDITRESNEKLLEQQSRMAELTLTAYRAKPRGDTANAET